MEQIEKLVKERALPALLSRDEMIDILLREQYGYLKDIPYQWSVADEVTVEKRMNVSRVLFSIRTKYGCHSFPVHRMIHVDGKAHDLIVFINFRTQVPDFYYPVELVWERGFDVLSFCYEDVTKDNDDFSDGLAGVLTGGRQEAPDAAGKIMIWAFAASRVLDHARSIGLNTENTAVLGHSRLGKTALVAGMLDERFRYVLSNDSGCGGAMLSKGSLGALQRNGRYGGPGEAISDTIVKFPFTYWYCPNRYRYADKNYADTFDQHFLLAAIAPRYICVGTADEDDWADNDSQFLCCAAASEMWTKSGRSGFVCPDRFPDAGEAFISGHIGFYTRPGGHYLSRHDWIRYMDFMDEHRSEK